MPPSALRTSVFGRSSGAAMGTGKSVRFASANRFARSTAGRMQGRREIEDEGEGGACKEQLRFLCEMVTKTVGYPSSRCHFCDMISCKATLLCDAATAYPNLHVFSSAMGRTLG